jgi:hypothetical protein
VSLNVDSVKLFGILMQKQLICPTSVVLLTCPCKSTEQHLVEETSMDLIMHSCVANTLCGILTR